MKPHSPETGAFIGTAGWSVPRKVAEDFAETGSGLARYASVFNAVEINSTFYRRHRPQTFERWRDSVPEGFRFAVKIPQAITHEARMRNVGAAFEAFLGDIGGLGVKLGPLLCQLPPSLPFTAPGVAEGLRTLRAAFYGMLVIEPRHPTWAGEEASALLKDLSIPRVLADPPVIEAEATPLYIRLHGKPKVYYSAYEVSEIADFAARLAPDGWCIFDNTASGAAIENALTMLAIRRGTLATAKG